MSKHDRIYQQIEKHGRDLQTIFGIEGDPVKTCKRLRLLEIRAHKLAEDYCNGNITLEQWEDVSENILSRVNKILNYGSNHIHVFINADPRGYALKINDDFCRDKTIYKDWGRYGIIAPDFRED